MEYTMFLDIETTGFSRQWCYILEIAAEVVDERGNSISSFHEYIRPGVSIPAKVVELTGITNAQVSRCRPESAVLLDFCEWACDHPCKTVVGHNARAFDIPFICARCEKYGYVFPQMEIVDTLSIARQLVKSGTISVANCKQPTLAEYFGIEYEAHSALEDVRALQQLYSKIIALTKPATRASLGF